jgi:CO/xanthine dehydrogenase FAD-binding subunit
MFITLFAQVRVFTNGMFREMRLEDLYSGDGVNPFTLPKEALITGIILDLSQDFQSRFEKIRVRESMDFTSISCAFSKLSSGYFRMALGGVDPAPVFVEGNLNSFEGDIKKSLLKKARSVDNDYYSRKYRREVLNNLMDSCLNLT